MRIDAELAEEGLHAEGPGLVGHDGHDVAADVLVAHQADQQPHEGHGAGHFAAFAAGEEFGEILPLRRLQLDRRRAAAGHETAQRLAVLLQVAHFRAVGRRLVEVGVGRLLVGNGNLEAAAELDQLGLVELLLLVGDVAAFAGLAQPVALDGLGQDDRGRAAVLDGRLVGRVDLQRIVAAALQLAGVCSSLRSATIASQPRIDAEEMLADVAAGHDGVFLILAVDDFAHAADQQAVGVARQQRVPVRAPEDLDHVPAGAAEGPFQFLDDLAVAADRAVQPLEVAVDDEDQVVQLLAGRPG